MAWTRARHAFAEPLPAPAPAATLRRRMAKVCHSCGKGPLSARAAATRWSPPSAASTRTSRRCGSSSACAAPRVRLHALPEGRQGHQGRLSARPAAVAAGVSDPSLVRFRAVVAGRARAPRVAPPGDQRPQRLPGRRRRHGRQHGAHAARRAWPSSTAWPRERALDRRDRPRRDRRVGRPRRAARRARQQRRHPLPAHPRRRRGAGLAPGRAGRPGPDRRRDGARRPARLRRRSASRPRARCSRSCARWPPASPPSSRTCPTPRLGPDADRRAAEPLHRRRARARDRRRRGVGRARPRAAARPARGGRRRRRRLRRDRSSSPASSPRCAATDAPELEHHAPGADHASRARVLDLPLLHELRRHRRRRSRPRAFVARARGDRRLGARRRRPRDAEGPRPHRRPRAGDRASSPARARSRASTSPTCARRSPSASARLAGNGGRARGAGAAARWPSSPAPGMARAVRVARRHVLDGGADAEPVDATSCSPASTTCPPRRSSCCPTAPNVIMAAERAAELSEKVVRVVPSRSQQAGLAAAVALDADRDARPRTPRAMDDGAGARAHRRRRARRARGRRRAASPSATPSATSATSSSPGASPRRRSRRCSRALGDDAELVTCIAGDGAPLDADGGRGAGARRRGARARGRRPAVLVVARVRRVGGRTPPDPLSRGTRWVSMRRAGRTGIEGVCSRCRERSRSTAGAGAPAHRTARYPLRRG